MNDEPRGFKEFEGFNRFLQKTDAFKNFAESLSKQVTEIEKAVVRFDFGDIIEIVQKNLDAAAPAYKDALLELGNHGWYISQDMTTSATLQLAKGFKQGNPNADIALEKFFEDKLDEIESNLVGKFPDRAKAIAAAFRAHRQGEYFLSIPVLLAQADGICIEIAKESLFMRSKTKNDGSPQTADYVVRLGASSFMDALLSPLSTNLPIAFSQKQRAPGFTYLNRHVVMHGESSDYGTKTNSLKAISLLNYVAEMLT